MMKPPFALVPDDLSPDTVEALEQMLTLARAGKIIGLAFCVMLKERRYWVNTAGEGRRNPGFSLQMVRMLDDSLVSMLRPEQWRDA